MTEVRSDAPAAPTPDDKFYEIRVSGKQVQLRIHPPEKGRRANLSDIQRELRQREVSYRHETLFDIYKRAANEFEPLALQETSRFFVEVEADADGQHAYLTVVPPDLGEDTLTPGRLKQALEQAKVHKGINYEVVKDVLLEQKAVDKLLIAQGQPKEDGIDGRIELVEAPKGEVVVDENKADYRELNLINNVNEGDLIAHIVYPTAGTDGFDVHAHPLRARPGKRARMKLGRNVRLSEAGTELFATKAGFVVRLGDKFSVEAILELPNVDAQCGNVRFKGVVRVRGQVDDGFSIEAEKGIEVGGTVGKAVLRSKGDVKIFGGAFGSTLECDGNLGARFLSECTVKAGGNVLVDEYVLHSTLVAGRTVKVTREPKGFITGGRIRAGVEIWSPNVGSDVSEVHTALEVGAGVNTRKRFDTLQERIDVNLETFDAMRKNLLFLQRERERGGVLEGRKAQIYEQTMTSANKLVLDLLRQGQLHHEMLGSIAEPEEELGVVMVSQHVNPGTTVQIQTSKVSVRDPLDACAFLLIDGALKAMAYGHARKLHKQKQAQRKRAAG